MRLAIGQINSRLGDFEYNKSRMLEFALKAKEAKCDLIIFPEASLFGYHPVDLLERPSLVYLQEKVLKSLHQKMPKGISILLGAIVTNPKVGKAFLNAAVLLEKGKPSKVFAKQLLPTYDVFDEARHIQPGEIKNNIFTFKGKKILVTICEDIWAWSLKGYPKYSQYKENPIKKIKPSQVDLVLNLSASPFALSKFKNRRLVTQATAGHLKAPLVYVNMVGAQDELIFDGGSFAIDPKGKVIDQCQRFEEDFSIVEPFSKNSQTKNFRPQKLQIETNQIANLFNALVLGIRDFVSKTGFKKVHLGSSGGIDSAVVACVAAHALGSENVTTFALPGPFSSPDSAKWAKDLATNLKIAHFEIPIGSSYEDLLKNFERAVGKKEFGVTNENLQARLRGIYLMAHSNRAQSLLLGTSNKSELAVGYSTLYGDLCGGLLPIGDLLKSEVYDLAKYICRDQQIIPLGIIDRPPSAELRPNQKDEDSLPPYSVLDPIVKRLVEGQSASRNELERKILSMLLKSEFKRWQSPPILKISDHSFGRGRRFPIASSASE